MDLVFIPDQLYTSLFYLNHINTDSKISKILTAVAYPYPSILLLIHTLFYVLVDVISLRTMENDEMKWLLKGKVVTDFRGFPVGKVKKVWFDHTNGPMVIIERGDESEAKNAWEAIPLRSVDSVTEHVRLKPPAFAE